MTPQHASVGTTADIQSGVEISKVHRGYFSSKKNADAFCEIGIKPTLPDLPKQIKLIDLGSGEGFLTKTVENYLKSRGYAVDAYALDANARFLEKANSAGLKTIHSSIQDSNAENADLIIARAFIHYNSQAEQQKLFDKIFQSLKPGGYFVHQMSSGSKENCELRSNVVNLRSIGRAAANQKYHWLSEEACIKMMLNAGFQETVVSGYAPVNAWTLQEQWDRFNKKKIEEATETGDEFSLQKIESNRQKYLAAANRLIQNYLEKYKNKDQDVKKVAEDTYLIKYAYPILISKK